LYECIRHAEIRYRLRPSGGVDKPRRISCLNFWPWQLTANGFDLNSRFNTTLKVEIHYLSQGQS
jgi:hypothetical protein